MQEHHANPLQIQPIQQKGQKIYLFCGGYLTADTPNDGVDRIKKI